MRKIKYYKYYLKSYFINLRPKITITEKSIFLLEYLCVLLQYVIISSYCKIVKRNINMHKTLSKYVEFAQTFQENSFMIILDLDFKVLFAGKEYLNVIKKTPAETLGKLLSESTPIPEKNRILSKIAFTEAIQEQKVKEVFIANLYHPYPSYYTLLLTFHPIIDPSSNTTVGAKLEFIPAEIAYFFHILVQISEKIEPNGLEDNDDFLTPREHQIAFLLCHCKDLNEIANIMSLFNNKKITAKTVANIISRYLFTKFKVTQRDELMLTLREHGYHQKMPNSLLSNQFIDLTKR